MTTQATEIGQLAASAIAEIVDRATAAAPVAAYVEAEPLAWATVADGGWDSIGVPESHGGGDASLRDLVEVAQAWGAGAIPLPLLESIWVKRWSLTARSHDGPMSISVARTGGVEAGGLAPFGALPGVVLAREIGGQDRLDDSPDGVLDELAPSLRALVVSWSTTIPPEAAFELAVIWAAEAVGAAQRLLEVSVQYAKEREQFGKPIGSFQAVKHLLADMHSDVQYAQSAAIWGSLEPENAARCSLFALEKAISVAEDSIQVHGGMGFTWEMGLHFYLRSMLTRRELVRGLLA